MQIERIEWERCYRDEATGIDNLGNSLGEQIRIDPRRANCEYFNHEMQVDYGVEKVIESIAR